MESSQRSHSIGNKQYHSFDHRQQPTKRPNLQEIPLHQSREELHQLEMSKLTQRPFTTLGCFFKTGPKTFLIYCRYNYTALTGA